MSDYGKISYLGVFCGALASHIVGALWFGPLFGKMWLHYSNWQPEHLEKIDHEAMMKSMVLSFLGQILMAFVLAYFIRFMRVRTMAGALKISFLIWLGFIATVTMNGFLWHNEKFEFYLINLSSNLARIMAMTVVYAAIALKSKID